MLCGGGGGSAAALAWVNVEDDALGRAWSTCCTRLGIISLVNGKWGSSSVPGPLSIGAVSLRRLEGGDGVCLVALGSTLCDEVFSRAESS